MTDRLSILEDRFGSLEQSASSESHRVEISSPIQSSYADMVSGKASTENELVLMTKMHSEIKKKENATRNLIVVGLPEVVTSNEEGVVEESNVDQLLRVLDINSTQVKRKFRLRKRGSTPNPNQPCPLLFELDNTQLVDKAITNSKKLRSINEFKKVYVNRDLTESERKFEAELRKRRNDENKKLPHVDEHGRRYGINETTNQRYFWRVDRQGRLAQVEIKPSQ